MKRLYGVFAHFNDNPDVKRDYVYYVKTEEDAKNEFLKDWNHRMYLTIEGICIIKSDTCVIDYQLYQDIYGCDEYNCKLVECPNGTDNFYIEVENVRNFGTIQFRPFDCHFDLVEGNLSLMVCLANGEPNWLY